MLGTASQGPENQKTLVVDLEDFDNVFGNTAPSRKAVALFFAQRTGTGLYFLNVAAAGAYPTVAEITTALGTFVTEDAQGFLICPEFYQATGTGGSLEGLHDEVALACEAHCADTRFYWVHLVDCSPTVATAANVVTASEAERAALASPLGHSAYYLPYLVLADDSQVAPSPAIAGVAVRRFRTEGYRQPPAGVKYPIYGISGVSKEITDKTQGELNPDGINVIRRLPRKGVVIWAARTLSTLPLYRHLNGRVVLNVLAGTYRSAFDELLLSAVDGLGEVFGVLKATAVAILEPLRLAGAIYGSTPEEAYRVVCDRTNNPGILLDAGEVNLDIYVKVSPTLEFLNIRLNRVSLTTDLNTLLEPSTLGA
jgi:hypothetical protein